MRFSLDQPTLAAALQRAVAFADPRSPIPILACVRLEISESSLSLYATNMTFSMTASVPLVGGEPGAVATEAVRLANLVASLRPGEPVELHYDPALSGMAVKSGRTKARLGVLDPEHLPVFAQVLPEPQIRIKADALDRALAFVLPAMGSDIDRAALWGAALSFERDGITLAACDGHMGAVCRPQAEMVSEFPAATLPRPLIPKLRALLKGNEGEAEIAIGPRAVRITSADWSIVTKLIDAGFPDYHRWMAMPVTDPVVVDRAELTAALARVEAATDPDNTKLKQRGALLSFAEGLLLLCAKNHIIEDAMPAVYNGGNPAEIGINTGHVQAILTAIDAAEIELHFKDRNSPIRVCAKDEIEDAFTTTPYRV